MKNITLLLILLTVSFGYSQIDITFDPAPLEGSWAFNAGEPMTTTDVVDAPIENATYGKVGRMISNAAGMPWQNAILIMTDNTINVTTTKTITADVYYIGATPIAILGKLTAGVGQPDKEVDGLHPGTGWSSVTWDFTPVSATGEYNRISFFPNRVEGGGNWEGTNGDTVSREVWIDNIMADAGAAIVETCNDGVKNQGETEIDCGGPNCDACPAVPTDAPPLPTEISLFDIYSTDIDGTTLVAPGFVGQDFSGGTTTTGVSFSGNEVLKYSGVNFVGAKWDEVDVTALSGNPTHIHLDYWATDVSVFKFFLIDIGLGESPFDLVTEDGGIVLETWTGVDIPLSAFSNPLTKLFQWKLDAIGGNAGDIYLDNVYIYSKPAVTSGYCNEVVNAFGGDAGSDIKLTIERQEPGFRSMKVTIESNDADPVDDLVLPGPITGNPTPSAPDTSDPGKISITLTWNGEDPAADVVLPNVLWSKVSNPGNWALLETGDITVPFESTCSGVLSTNDFTATSFKVFPNPTQNNWKVNTKSEKISSIRVFDILGKNVISISPNSNEATIDGTSLKRGMYFAQIKTAKGLKSIKIIKK
ncbi:T9SS type A sorting domain-containing protein [Thalassobellus sediminis]|uniref:T9SS type A sorting domain-containing protein n=1 Tax=Thalassobellus sediminis TaxID=3367753 RepID=UPI0037A74A54